MPVDAEGIEDCNISIHAEDDSDDHDSHLDHLQGRMVEVGIRSVVEVSDVVFIYFVQLDDECRDNFKCEVAGKWEPLLAGAEAWNNGKEVPILDLTSSTMPGQQIHYGRPHPDSKYNKSV